MNRAEETAQLKCFWQKHENWSSDPRTTQISGGHGNLPVTPALEERDKGPPKASCLMRHTNRPSLNKVQKNDSQHLFLTSMHTYVCLHIYTRSHLHTSIHICTHACVCTCVHTHTYTHTANGKNVTEQKIISSLICPLNLCPQKLRTSPDLQDKAALLARYSFVPWRANSAAVRSLALPNPPAS